MSRLTGPHLAVMASHAALCLVLLVSGVVGCGYESEPTAAVELSPPSPGQITGDPISPPYLSDLAETQASQVVMRFGDGTLLVQNSASGKVEIVPTPDPDANSAGKAKAGSENRPTKADPRIRAKVESIPTPEPDAADSEAAKSEPESTTSVAGAEGPEDYRTWPIPDVTLVVTGRQHGYIEPCGCTGLDRQKGGMARRFTLMRQMKEKGWKLVPVDAGDQVRRFGRQAAIKLQQTTKALQEMDYQAVGFGPDDLRLGVGELLAVAAAESPEQAMFVSANVVLIDPELMPATKVVEQKGIRVGLTSILDPESLEVKLGHDIIVGEMVPNAQKAVEKLQADQASLAPIRDHEAVEAPLALQDRALQIRAGGHRRTADLVEAVHQRGDAGVDRGAEGRQHDVAQGLLREVGGVVVATTFGEAVACEVLGAGGDGVEGAQVGALEAAHPCFGDSGAEVRILAGPLHDPAPARVARDVDHRREGPVDAGGGGLGGGDPRRALDRLEIPAGGFTQRDREYGLVAVDHVVAEDQRDAETAALDRHRLRRSGRLGTGDVQHRADAAARDLLASVAVGIGGRAGDIEVGAVLVELTDLLRQGHLCHQLVDPLLDRGVDQRAVSEQGGGEEQREARQHGGQENRLGTRRRSWHGTVSNRVS